jgi:DNA-directed RNA polymerase specialized sigma24 family protein
VAGRLLLLDLLARLPHRQPAVVVLRFYCGLTVAETAELLRISPGTVKSQPVTGGWRCTR